MSSEEANYQQNVSPNNNESSSLIPRSSKLVVSMLDDYDNDNDNDDYENRSRNRSHRLSKRRAFNLSTNSNVYLEYINIIGNPSMVEKYLSDTVRLQPKEKQRKERQIREVTDLTKKFEDLELSYRKRRTPNFIDVSKLRKSNNVVCVFFYELLKKTIHRTVINCHIRRVFFSNFPIIKYCEIEILRIFVYRFFFVFVMFEI